MNKISNFLEKYLLPISFKISNFTPMKSLSNGMMSVLPIMMVGAVFAILTNLPIDAYKEFIANVGISKFFILGTRMTTDIIAIYMTFAIGRSFAKGKGYGHDAGSIGIIALLAFFIMMPFGTSEAGVNFFEFTYLGSMGIFVGIICGIVTPIIYDAVVKANITIKLPEGVPSNVATSFINIIPALAVAVFFLFLNFIFTLTPSGNIFAFIYAALQAPLQGLVGNMASMVIIIILCQILWFFGIHGSMTVLTVIFPLWISMYAENMTAFMANGTVPNPINVTFFDFTTIGGTGCTLGLAIMMAFFSKSKQHKTFGKLFLPCGLFNINEPMVFSMPLMLNTMFVIPFILVPLLAVVMAYLAIVVFGLVPAPVGMMNLAYIPAIFRGIINCGVPGAILEVAIVAMSMVVYYPFFKIADNQALALEKQSDVEAPLEQELA